MSQFRDASHPAGDGHAGLPVPAHHHPGEDCEYRRFYALQPIVDRDRRPYGCEALFRAGWEDAFYGDPDYASRIMVDNWLLYGFEEKTGAETVFLNCTRDTLVSGILYLLPRTAVFEIVESVEPDPEVLAACRSLKAAGYRIAVDDLESLDTQAPFIELADAVKVDFRLAGWRDRMQFLERLKKKGVALIAEKIETEDEFQQAVEEGFELFQGYHLGRPVFHSKAGDRLKTATCLNLLEQLQMPGFRTEDFLELIEEHPGLERRLLRLANWAAAPNLVFNSSREALAAVGRTPLYRAVTLALTVAPAMA
ncbi:MAG: EAL and HDOD domain-containing protein [Acidobacteriota bacterium]